LAPAFQFPDPPTGITDGEDNPGGEAHDPDTDPDCFKNCGTSSVKVVLTITTAAADTQVGVWFGGHLAQAADPTGSAIGWGSGCNGASLCGASAITGAPFHIKHEGRDNPVSGAGVVPPSASITIIKDAVPDDPQDFSFTSNISSGTCTLDATPAAFVLDDDPGSSPPSNTETCTNVTPGSYTVTETDPTPAFDLTALVCTGEAGRWF